LDHTKDVEFRPGHIASSFDSNTIWNAISLGPFYEINDNLTVARSHYEEDLLAEEADHGSNHPHVAITLNNLGRVLKAQGNINGAQLHFQRAMEIDEAVYGPSHAKVAFRASVLGDMLHDLGGLRDARRHYHKALHITIRPNVPYIKISLHTNSISGGTDGTSR